MERFLSKRIVIGIVAAVILTAATIYFLHRNNKDQISLSPDYESPSSIVESYSRAKLYGGTEFVIECIVPEKRSEPLLKTFMGVGYRDLQFNFTLLNVEHDGSKGNVTYHATLKIGEPAGKTELKETVPVVRVKGKWYIDRQEDDWPF